MGTLKSHNGYIYLAVAVLGYASMGALTKVLGRDLEPFWQTFLWLSVSALLTTFLVRVHRSPWRLRRRSDYPVVLVMGIVGFGLQSSLFTFSLYHSTIGNTLFIFSAYPLLVAVLAYFVLREQITRRLLVALVLMCCVLFLLFEPNHINTHLPGNISALAACVFFALYIICNRVLALRGNNPETITLWGVALAALTAGVLVLCFERRLPAIHVHTAFYILVFGVLNCVAYNMVGKGLSLVRAGVGSIMLMLEPVFGTAIGMLFFKETPTANFLTGSIVMVTAIYIANFRLD